MGFRINTNIGAMNAHMYATKNNANLDKSLSALSSGLRINKAADDASGMAIADSLRAQSNGLGQAIRNANDGIGVVQTADGALDEYINIINTVRTKSIQAASDGQNSDSRAAIQRDIDKLLEEAQNIAKTTSFNGQQLLDGTFTNKQFHIGAYANETVGVSIGNVQTNAVGGVTSIENVTTNGGNEWNKSIDTTNDTHITAGANGVVYNANVLTVNGTDVTSSINTLNPQNMLSAKSIAAAITDATGLMTSASTEVKGDAAVQAGSINETTNFLKINGYNIGDVTVLANDSDGSLVKAINNISHLTGVTAENVGGSLKLTAEDGRNISITTGTATAVGNGAGTADTISGFTTNRSTVSSTAADIANIGSTSTSAVTLAEGALIINGVDLAGTYGDGTAGSSGQQLLAAIRNISGMEDTYFTDNGADATVNFVVNNGNDLNLGGTATANGGAWETGLGDNGIINNSVIGEFKIYSNEKVVIGGSNPDDFALTAGGYTPKSNNTSLDTIDVKTRMGAELGIMISDSALKALDTIRSELGSVQNQLESTIRNISVTQVNVSAAESQIRDVDFAAESANFSKFNILAQSGSYAMSQANAVQQNVLRLLQ